MTGNRVISGTWGEVWLNGEIVGECYGLQAKMAMTKEAVNLCGQMAEDSKVVSVKCTGSLKLHKVNSRLAIAIGGMTKAGRDPRFTVMTKLADPDSYGTERIVLNNVSFDDLTLADWETAKKGTVEAPFTFTDFQLMEKIGVM